jgi:hypothetical protein
MRPLLPPLIILLVAGLFGMRFLRDLCAFSDNAKLLLRLMRSSDSEAGLEHLVEKSHYTLGSDWGYPTGTLEEGARAWRQPRQSYP